MKPITITITCTKCGAANEVQPSLLAGWVGRHTSKAKAAAARRNGLLGGKRKPSKARPPHGRQIDQQPLTEK